MGEVEVTPNNGAEVAPDTPPMAELASGVERGRPQHPAPAPSGGVLREEADSEPASVAPPVKRGPGRPKGYPRSGGRKKGTPNRTTVQTRERIQELADPIKFMSDVMLGKRLVAAGEPGDSKKTWPSQGLASPCGRRLRSRAVREENRSFPLPFAIGEGEYLRDQDVSYAPSSDPCVQSEALILWRRARC